MELLSSPSACINLAKTAISRHPRLQSLFLDRDYTAWQKKLVDEGEGYALNHIPFNLLTASIISGLGLKRDFLYPGTLQAHRLLFLLNQYLGIFPVLQADKSFRYKIGNLEGYNFMATINELALASHYARRGYQVSFETKFTRTSGNRRKDVDLTIIDEKGTITHLEVYMPIDETIIEGFFDPSETDHNTAYKIGQKALDKFGDQGITGLISPVILAINTVLLPHLSIQQMVNPRNLIKLQDRIAQRLPEGVDGLLHYVDDFSGENSLVIQDTYLKSGIVKI